MSAAILAGGMVAGARTINTLIINRTDGKVDKIAMNENLDIHLGAKGDEVMLVHPSITVAYPLSFVKTYTVGFQNFATGNYYIGDHEVKDEPDDAIVAPEVDGLEIAIENGVIRIGGLKGDARLIDLGGKTLVSVKPASGTAEIRTETLPSGVYLLSADKTTLKIKI